MIATGPSQPVIQGPYALCSVAPASADARNRFSDSTGERLEHRHRGAVASLGLAPPVAEVMLAGRLAVASAGPTLAGRMVAGRLWPVGKWPQGSVESLTGQLFKRAKRVLLKIGGPPLIGSRPAKRQIIGDKVLAGGASNPYPSACGRAVVGCVAIQPLVWPLSFTNDLVKLSRGSKPFGRLQGKRRQIKSPFQRRARRPSRTRLVLGGGGLAEPCARMANSGAGGADPPGTNTCRPFDAEGGSQPLARAQQEASLHKAFERAPVAELESEDYAGFECAKNHFERPPRTRPKRQEYLPLGKAIDPRKGNSLSDDLRRPRNGQQAKDILQRSSYGTAAGGARKSDIPAQSSSCRLQIAPFGDSSRHCVARLPGGGDPRGRPPTGRHRLSRMRKGFAPSGYGTLRTIF